MKKIIEGSAQITINEGVFFNPKMEGLRTLSVLFLKAFDAKGSLIDCTAATGVRAIRYAKEVGIKDVTILDINKRAFDNAVKNMKSNGIDTKAFNEDLQAFAGRYEDQFDIIDLDPFGSAAPYIQDILKISKNGSLLMITATDTAVLCGAHLSACIKTYASRPLHGEPCKEAGLRILIGYISRIAAQFNFGIEVLLSLSDLHYFRVFLRLNKGAKKALDSVKTSGFGAYCHSCQNFVVKKGVVPSLNLSCEYCTNSMDPFGSLWIGNLYDKRILKDMYALAEGDAKDHINILVNEEDIPLFYSLPKITRHLHLGSVSPNKIISVLHEMGYKASATQFGKEGIKTNANLSEIRKILKEV
jgi:tRNA (guanine26-N2/guanine27-N2)-dimethyltransferase